MSVLATYQFLSRHPLTHNDLRPACRRYLKWQLLSRLKRGPITVSFVNNTVLVVERGMAGATGNIYAGLHDFAEMSFLCHFLRPEDLFVDVGANVGTYSILAGGVASARCHAYEPVPKTFQRLKRNVRANNLLDKVAIHCCAIGARDATLPITSNADATNHLLRSGEEDSSAIEVPVKKLDDLLSQETPAAIKIDVEGFEPEVIEGASNLLLKPDLRAIIIEVNEPLNFAGTDASPIVERMHGYGFQCVSYEAFTRKLCPIARPQGANAIFVRDQDFVNERLRAAAPFRVNGRSV